MKKEKLGFFKKLYLVITDFRTYPFLIKSEKFFKSVLYLVTLTFILSAIFSLNLFSKFNKNLTSVTENYEELVPEFELVNGKLDVDAIYNEKLNTESFLVINTDYTYEEYINTKEYSSLVIYDNVTLVNSDKITVNTPYSILKINFDEFKFDMNKDGFYTLLTQDLLSYIPYFIILFLSVFCGYFVAAFFKVISLSFIIAIISIFTGVRLNFKNYIKISIYAYSLPLIIEMLAFCIRSKRKRLCILYKFITYLCVFDICNKSCKVRCFYYDV